jgi:adenine-specific DNA-methyltransferase
MTNKETLNNVTEGFTVHFKSQLAKQLSEFLPEVLVDGKIDSEKLKELIGEDLSEDRERFGLFWPGKKQALRAAQESTSATLKPERGLSEGWETTQNVFIEGDNLEVLKILQKHYHGKVKLIYIDPPYNTGKDFVYPDNYKEGLQSYLEWSKQVNEEGKKLSTNAESEGRYHSNWLNMMYPRLKLARNLLTSDGVICVSIDDHEVDNLKKIMVEIFGEANFLAQMIWDKQHSQQQGIFKRYHEYVLVFSRNASLNAGISGGEGFIEAGALKKVSKANPASEFTFPAGVRFDAPDGFTLTGTFGDSEKVTVVQGKLSAMAGLTTESVTLSAGWTQKNQMKSWFAGTPTIDSKGQEVVEFYFNSAGKLKSRKKRSVVTPPTILPRYGMVSSQTEQLDTLLGGHYFDNPKPIKLIQDFVSWFTADEDLVLDFFAGSGTTSHAVMCANLEDGGNRRCIQVQLPEPTDEVSEARKAGFKTIADVTRHRIKQAAARVSVSEGDLISSRQEPMDSGFRTFKLADTGFSKWKITSEVEINKLEQHFLDLRDSAADSSTPEDLLFETLIKQGYSLSEEIGEMEIDSTNFMTVGGDLVIAYMAQHQKPSLDVLRKALDKKPARFIMTEDAFMGDDELKTNLAQECKSRKIEFWTV